MKHFITLLLLSASVLLLAGCATPTPITFDKMYEASNKPLSDTALIIGLSDSTNWVDNRTHKYQIEARLLSVNGQRVRRGIPIPYTGVWVEAGAIDIELQLRVKERMPINKNGQVDPNRNIYMAGDIGDVDWRTVDRVRYRATIEIPPGKEALWKLNCDLRKGVRNDFVEGRNPEVVSTVKHFCYPYLSFSDNPTRINVGQDLTVISDEG